MSTLPFLTDSFTDTAGTAITSHTGELGATWVKEDGGGSANAVITDSNRLRSNGVTSGNFFCSSGTPATPDYWVEAQVYVASVLDYYAGVGGRMVVDITSGYWAIYRPSLLRWELALTSTVLGSYAQVLTVGQTYAVRLDMVGTTIRLLVDGVERVSVTNSTLTAAGKAGVILFGSHTNTTGMHLSGITAEAVRKSLVVCDGDSITAGTGGNTLPWPTQLDTDQDATWTIVNKGISGQTLAQMEADATTDIDPLFSADNARNALVCFGGVNDVWSNVDGNGDDGATTTLGLLATYCAHRQAAGWYVIVVTMLPSTVAGGGALPAVAQTHFNTRRAAFNTSIRVNYLTYANQVADVAADTTIGDDGDDANATYYQSDRLHPTNAGATIIKDLIKTAILAEILPVTGTMAVSIGAPAIAMTGTETFTGTLAVSFGVPAIAATGDVGAAPAPYQHASALPAIWAAFTTALNVPAITTTLGCGVYDQIPRKPTFPYLRISSPTETRQDTFAVAGKDVTIQIHIFTSSDVFEGAVQAQAILSAVIGKLHYVPFAVAGYDLLTCQYETGIDAGDDDVNGVLIKHYVATFRVQVMELVAA